MRYFLRNLAVSGVILAQLSSCTKSASTEPVDTKILGTWEWTRTDGGIANNIHETPASTGQQITLTLGADNHYRIMVNKAIKSEGSFSISNRQCIHDHESKPYIQFDQEPGRMVESVDSLVLHLSDEAYDGVDYEYHRAGVTDPK